MSIMVRCNADWGHMLSPGNSLLPDAAAARHPFKEPTLDQLLAEPIVRQLMRRDRADAASIRYLVQKAAAARPALSATNDFDADDPNAIVRQLHETARLWLRRCDREMRAQLPGMTRARCSVLVHLAQHEGVNQAALAQILDIRPIVLVRLLDGLEAAGFIARMHDPGDRRAHILALTGKARPVIEDIYRLTRKTYDDLHLSFSRAESGQLRALLCRVRSSLSDRRPGAPDHA